MELTASGVSGGEKKAGQTEHGSGVGYSPAAESVSFEREQLCWVVFLKCET